MSIFHHRKYPLSLVERLTRLNQIGIALSTESNLDHLMEKILFSAMEITNADGGTLYSCRDNALHFEILLNDSLQIHQGGSSTTPVELPPIMLHNIDGSVNHHNVAAYCANTRKTIIIEDSYSDSRFDFSGTRAFDQRMGYHSQAFLSVPVINHENELINVIQLINPLSGKNGKILGFSDEFVELIESLASQAAIAISNKRLIKDLKLLFNSLVQLIADAIDDKSPYTGGHCRRVTQLTLLLADAASKTDHPTLQNFTINDDDRYELEIAALLHDCGKIITPEHVHDKATKLQTIHDRISEVETRFEVIKRDAKIDYLEKLCECSDDITRAQLKQQYLNLTAQLDDDMDFLRMANKGSEYISPEQVQRIEKIARYQWQCANGDMQNLLSEEEIYNLKISRGTLTSEERQIINEHINNTIKMLEALHYPSYLKNVPEYAGGHHEKMDGTGYPRGLTREQLSIPARIMAIADIFEAVTAPDRPYRDPLKLSEALALMNKFKQDNHIDADLFDVFVREKVYLNYAYRFMTPEQLDEVDESLISG